MFDQPAWQALKLKRVRYVVAWDYYKDPGQVAETTAFMNARPRAQPGRAGDVHRSSRLLEREALLEVAARAALRRPAPTRPRSGRSGRAFPCVKTYAPWNEANHVSQPTSKSPKRAAQYYDVLRKECKGCKVLAADVLDQSNVTSYLRSFIRYSHNRGRMWGLHNYKDVNRRQSKGLTNVLKTVPGRGLADRDRRHHDVPDERLQDVGVARRVGDEVHVPARGPVRLQAQRLQVQADAAVRLPLVR